MKNKIRDLAIENAVLVSRNFSGKKGKFNAEGRRNFSVQLRSEDGEKLAKDGWPIRCALPKDEYDDHLCYMTVKVKFEVKPPVIYLVSGNNKTLLSEENLNILDYIDIENADLILSPYQYEFNGKEGITAYLKKAYITIKEDKFDQKYRDLPDSAVNSIMNEEFINDLENE